VWFRFRIATRERFQRQWRQLRSGERNVHFSEIESLRLDDSFFADQVFISATALWRINPQTAISWYFLLFVNEVSIINPTRSVRINYYQQKKSEADTLVSV
jgi:hypothetical protein